MRARLGKLFQLCLKQQENPAEVYTPAGASA